jgi:ATP phosphoribosyltransferase regulatory subunit
VTLAIAACRAAGARGLTLDLTLPDLVDTLAAGPMPLPPAQVEAIRRELDMKDAVALQEAGGTDYLPLLYAAGPFEQALEKLENIDAGGALASRINGLRALLRVLAKGTCASRSIRRNGTASNTKAGSASRSTLEARGAVGAAALTASRARRVATGFSVYMEPLLDAAALVSQGSSCFSSAGTMTAAAARLRAEGWRTVAALSERDEATQLGCYARLDDGEALGPVAAGEPIHLLPIVHGTVEDRLPRIPAGQQSVRCVPRLRSVSAKIVGIRPDPPFRIVQFIDPRHLLVAQCER